jgi:aminopeptidase N
VGEIFTVGVAYHGHPPVIGGYKGFRFESHQGAPVVATLSTPFLAHAWWPCVDGPAGKLDSVHLLITIPDTTIDGHPLYAAANGKLMSIAHPREGWVSFEWHETYPIVPYYVSVSVSNYAIFEDFYPIGRDSMPVPYYVFPEDSGYAAMTFEETVEMIEFFSGLYGEYPFVEEKYSMAEIGFYGAIENQTKTIMGGVTPGWYMVVAHELSHMWFGDMISPTSWNHCWVNEGFATYSEALWWEHKYGVEEYHEYMETLEYWSGGTVYLEDVSDPFSVFLTICYDKGAWVLHMLRGVVGDSTFFEVLHTYATDPEFMYGHACTEDFQAVAECVSGLDLSEFFDQWIYDEYYPWYYYTWSASEGRDPETWDVQVTVEQTQGDLGRRPVFVMPVDLRFTFADGDTTIRLWNDDTLETYVFGLDDCPIDLDLDPDEWILRYATEYGTDECPPVPIAHGQPSIACSPNPVRGSAWIDYALPSAGEVSLRVYDVSGKVVTALILGRRPAGAHRLLFDSEGWRNGVYFLRLSSEAGTASSKVLLFR